jgi:hypothetical protein
METTGQRSSMNTLRQAAHRAVEVMDAHMRRADTDEFYEAKEALRQALETDLARVGEVGVWVECESQEALEDGWCDWVCPKPQGYLMQCCDCGLIHEVESRVAKYEPRPSEVFEVVDDPDLQVQWRMKRRDDISPKQSRQWQGLTEEEINSVRYNRDWTAFWTDTIFARAIEAKLKDKNT